MSHPALIQVTLIVPDVLTGHAPATESVVDMMTEVHTGTAKRIAATIETAAVEAVNTETENAKGDETGMETT